MPSVVFGVMGVAEKTKFMFVFQHWDYLSTDSPFSTSDKYFHEPISQLTQRYNDNKVLDVSLFRSHRLTAEQKRPNIISTWAFDR